MSRPDLWPHQAEAIEKAGRLPGFGLFMDMGTGKTRSAIEIMERRNSKRALMVGTIGAMRVWEKSLPELESSLVIPLRGPIKDRAQQIRKTYSEPVVFVTNFEGAWQEPFRSAILKANLDHITADEAHRIKTPGSRISKTFSLFGNHIPYRLSLTGTPAADKPPDLYALYRFMDKRCFGTRYEDFLRRYTVRIWNGYREEIIDYQNEDELHEKMYTIAYRVSSDVLNLPEALDIEMPILLDNKSMDLYRKMRKELIASWGDSTVVANNTLTRDIRLQQITSGFTVDDNHRIIPVNTAKEDALSEFLQDVSEPVVVFCLFLEDLKAVHRAADRAGLKSGEVSGARNDLNGDSFPESVDVLAVQMRAGSESIDLTRSSLGIYYSYGWSLTTYKQSRARLRRPGQNATVRLYHMAAMNTVDSIIARAIAKKEEDTSYVVDQLRLE